MPKHTMRPTADMPRMPENAGVDHGDGQAELSMASVMFRPGVAIWMMEAHGLELIGDVQEAVDDPGVGVQAAGLGVEALLQIDGHRVAGHVVADQLGEQGQRDEVEGAGDGVPGPEMPGAEPF